MPDKKQSKKSTEKSKKKTDAEISAEQVVREEVYSSEERAKKRRRCCCDREHSESHARSHKCGCGVPDTPDPSAPKKNAKAHKCAGNAPAKLKTTNGNRPKQKGYAMIDRSDESADAGKS